MIPLTCSCLGGCDSPLPPPYGLNVTLSSSEYDLGDLEVAWSVSPSLASWAAEGGWSNLVLQLKPHTMDWGTDYTIDLTGKGRRN